jgi:endonuclease YncB( thermonuclease family)
MDELKKCGIETPTFSLDGINTYAKVVSVIDGDTIVLVIPVLNTYFKFNCRLSNIDTCEIHSSNEKVKEFGIKAKYRLIELISKKKLNLEEDVSKKDIQQIFQTECFLVYVKCYDFDKYGRLLIDLYLNKDEKSLSDILLEEKLAYVYNGRQTKLTEEQQLNLFK